MNTIATISETKRILSENDYFAKKKYGQNFLVSVNVVENILKIVEKDSTVIEVGVGLGAITQLACQKAKMVYGYDIDSQLLEITRKNLDFPNLELINQDFLTVDLESLMKSISGKKILISNLPYYITSDLLTKMIIHCCDCKDIVAMMQKEVADRFFKKQIDKQTNELQILAQVFCKVEKVCDVNRRNFIPSPSVDSTVLHFEMNDKRNELNPEKFYEFLCGCFSYRRKYVLSNLKKNGYSFDENKLEIYKEKRVEQLSTEDYINIYKDVTK